jgi:drug/metabolite transporter (DMT)-like permease
VPVPSRRRTLLLTAVTLVAFAGNSLLCRAALAEELIDPYSFTALRLGSGALVLYLLSRKAVPAARATAWDKRAGLALLVYALCFSAAYVTLDAGTGALLLFGMVQVTMIGAGLAKGERLGAVQALGFLAALAGVVWLVLPGVSAPDPFGALLMCAAGIGWGAYSLAGRGAQSPTIANARSFLLAAPAAALLLLPLSSELTLQPEGALLACIAGAGTSGIGYVIWYAALRGLSATSGAIVQLAVPLIAALGGITLLGESLSTRFVTASALTLGGIAVAILGKPAKP